jgi:two-component system, response regulator PdtaR
VDNQFKPERLLVLIVEDDRLLRMDAHDMIEEAGFEVLEAGHADEAIEILKARLDVRAIFTDIDMPAGSINGLQLAHDVRNRWPLMAIIVTSGQCAIDESHLPERGQFFTKPYSFQQITDTIRHLAA